MMHYKKKHLDTVSYKRIQGQKMINSLKNKAKAFKCFKQEKGFQRPGPIPGPWFPRSATVKTGHSKMPCFNQNPTETNHREIPNLPVPASEIDVSKIDFTLISNLLKDKEVTKKNSCNILDLEVNANSILTKAEAEPVARNPLKRSINDEKVAFFKESSQFENGIKRIKWEPKVKEINPVILEFGHRTIKE